jgi:hypothetical protein
VAVDLYGATHAELVALVGDLLIWDVTRSTDPSPEAIERWIELGAADLYGLVGDISVDAPCGGEAWRVRARQIIALFAAAMAEDAHYPERARDRRAGDYGQRLWDRHEKRTASLKADIEACRDGMNTGTAHGGVAHSFPEPPMFTRTMGT